MQLEFSIINEKYLLHDFDCGNEELNRFLAEYSLIYQKRHFGVTILLLDNSSNNPCIIGYYTLCPAATRKDELPDTFFKGPRPNPIPGFRLCRLAVSKEFQGQGFGGKLFIHALKKCLDQSELIGGSFVIIDSKDTKAKQFYESFGFKPIPKSDLTLIQSMKYLKSHL